MSPPLLRAVYASPAEFQDAFDREIVKGGLLVRGAEIGAAAAMSECRLSVEVAGSTPAEVAGRIACAVPGVGVAVVFDGVPAPLSSLADELRAPAEPEGESGPPPAEESDAPRGALSERIKAMTVQEKMRLALSGSRDERLALIRDPTKAAHLFVLKNPRIGLDEVQYAAKSTNLSPDAIKLIAQHKEWSANASVCAALVRNPKTPLPIALKLLERVPESELRTLAKGGVREQIVHAARRKIVH
jgi:hypothetical protein